jgi:hypothetical protein
MIESWPTSSLGASKRARRHGRTHPNGGLGARAGVERGTGAEAPERAAKPRALALARATGCARLERAEARCLRSV